MNVNVILDTDYICSQLSNNESSIRVANLFMLLKNKSNIIILQDNNNNILKNIVHQVQYNFENIETSDLDHAIIFITELAKGTDNFTFVTKENYENNIINFINVLKEKNYPVNLFISDKKIEELECFSLEELDSIYRILEKWSKKHTVSNNKEILNLKDKTNKINFNEYKKVLFNTFWCSSKITIVAREFYDAYFTTKKDPIGRSYAQKHKDEYEKGFRFLFNILEKIEILTEKKVTIEVVSGIMNYRNVDDFKRNKHKKLNDITEYLNSINDKFDFSTRIIKWDVGDERYIGEGHGRRIYSDYGGLETQFMPFEMYKKDSKSDNFYHKDTSFFFINEESYLNWNKIGKELS